MEAVKRKEKVFVGLSGGVDSSVSALLLLRQGYEVGGVFIRTWQPDWTPCTWRQDRRDAMRICARLGIKYHELDLEQVYKQEVADYMIQEYQRGRTPNPDVMCNRAVKFGGFLDWSLARGADYIATGHYVQIDMTRGVPVLARGADLAKDQSYFLWTLTSSQLQHVMFPVGHLEKPAVRAMAKKHNLLTAEKKDSQGICFLGDIDMQEFLRHYIDEKPGAVLNEAGEHVGSHDGALFFTLGQRHGFTITEKAANDVPRYVVAKDVESNTITVSENIVAKNKERLVALESCNYVASDPFQIGRTLTVEIRYHGTLQKAKLVAKTETSMQIEFETYDPTLSSGQSVVFYEDGICLGGGVVA